MNDRTIFFIVGMAYVATLAYFQSRNWRKRKKDIIMGINAVIWIFIMFAALKYGAG